MLGLKEQELKAKSERLKAKKAQKTDPKKGFASFLKALRFTLLALNLFPAFSFLPSAFRIWLPL